MKGVSGHSPRWDDYWRGYHDAKDAWKEKQAGIVEGMQSEIERLREAHTKSCGALIARTDECSTLRARLERAIEPGSEEALEMADTIELLLVSAPGDTPLTLRWEGLVARLRGEG